MLIIGAWLGPPGELAESPCFQESVGPDPGIAPAPWRVTAAPLKAWSQPDLKAPSPWLVLWEGGRACMIPCEPSPRPGCAPPALLQPRPHLVRDPSMSHETTAATTRRLAQSLAFPSSDPLSGRIVEHLWEEVVSGVLASGARLPTVRELAVALGTTPRTVERAFEELERLGVAATRAGEGTFVSLSPPDAEERERRRRLAEVARDAVAGAAVAGFGVEELMDAVSEWRGLPPPED